jgi:hypothetical protein
MISFALSVELQTMVTGTSSLTQLSNRLSKIQTQADNINKAFTLMAHGVQALEAQLGPAAAAMAGLGVAAKEAAAVRMPGLTSHINQVSELTRRYERLGAVAAKASSLSFSPSLASNRSKHATADSSLMSGMLSGAKMMAGFIGLEIGSAMIRSGLKSSADLQEQFPRFREMGYTAEQSRKMVQASISNPINGLSISDSGKVRAEYAAVSGHDASEADLNYAVTEARKLKLVTHDDRSVGDIAQKLIQGANLLGAGGTVGGKINNANLKTSISQASELVRLGAGKVNIDDALHFEKMTAPFNQMRNRPLTSREMAENVLLLEQHQGDAGNIRAAQMRQSLGMAKTSQSADVLLQAILGDRFDVAATKIPKEMGIGKLGKPEFFFDDSKAYKGIAPGDYQAQQKLLREKTEEYVTRTRPDLVGPAHDAEVMRTILQATQNSAAKRATATLNTPEGLAEIDTIEARAKELEVRRGSTESLETFHTAVQDLETQFGFLSGVIGTPLINQLTGFTQFLARVTSYVEKKAADHPNIVTAATYGIEGGAGLLGIALLPTIFKAIGGAGGWLSTQFKIVGTELRSSALTAATALEKMALAGERAARSPAGLAVLGAGTRGAAMRSAGYIAGMVFSESIGKLLPDFKGKETTMSALDYGLLGAQIGEFFGPWGAAIGAAAGALVGILIPNIESVGKALGSFAEAANKFQEKILKPITNAGEAVSKGGDYILKKGWELVHGPAPQPLDTTDLPPKDAYTRVAPSDSVIETPADPVRHFVRHKIAQPRADMSYGVHPDAVLPMSQNPNLAAAYPLPANQLSPVATPEASAPSKTDLYLNNIYANSIIVDSQLLAGMPSSGANGGAKGANGGGAKGANGASVSPLLGSPGFQSASGEPDLAAAKSSIKPPAPAVFPAGTGAEPDQAKAMGLTPAQWNAFAGSVAGIESKGKYNIAGGSGGKYFGKYQFGDAALSDTAKHLGVPVPSKQDFLHNPAMQEQFFAQFTKDNYDRLM